MKNLAKSTGFTTLQSSENYFPEAPSKILNDPTEDYSFNSFGFSERRDLKTRLLARKASSAYIVDSMVRQAVDKYSELFKDFSFKGGDKQVKYLEQRLTTMTLRTGEHWETLLTRIIHEYFKTGNAFIIKRRGGSGKSAKRALYRNKPYSISGLSLISGDRIDIFKDSFGGFGGWEIRGTKNDLELNLVLPSGTKLPINSTLITIGEMPKKKNVLVPGLDIVHVAYKKGADSHWGFGLTFAALEDVSLTRTIEQTTAVMVKKFSNPIIHHKIIRASSPLSGMQQEINMAYDLYRKSSPDGVIITGGNAEIKAVGSESQALRVEGYLKYFLGRSLAALGMSPILFGLESGGQGALEGATELVMMKVRFCQSEISRELEMFLINELLWEGGFDPYSNPDDQVHLVFDSIDQNAAIKMQTHAADMFTKNVATHGEARSMSNLPKAHDEKDLYLHKVEIPKTKAEAEAKGNAQKVAGVAVAKARPKPVRAKNSNELREILVNILPQKESQLISFFNLLEVRLGYDTEEVSLLFDPIKNLIGDEEAILELLLERLTNV